MGSQKTKVINLEETILEETSGHVSGQNGNVDKSMPYQTVRAEAADGGFEVFAF